MACDKEGTNKVVQRWLVSTCMWLIPLLSEDSDDVRSISVARHSPGLTDAKLTLAQ